MVGKIHYLADMKSLFAAQALDDVEATLGTPVPGLHRVEHDSPIGMKADPIVREDRIGCVRLGRVVDNDNVDALVSQ